jgi:hypothetical protein
MRTKPDAITRGSRNKRNMLIPIVIFNLSTGVQVSGIFWEIYLASVPGYDVSPHCNQEQIRYDINAHAERIHSTP